MFCAISSFATVFKKLSAAEASESIYMRERVYSFALCMLVCKSTCGFGLSSFLKPFPAQIGYLMPLAIKKLVETL